MYVLLLILFITGIQVQAQNQCSCSCCLGQSCQPALIGNVNVQNCSAEICLTQCRCTYSQCSAASTSYGQVLSQCLTTVNTLYTCRCLCCNAGTPTCAPIFIGYTSAYSCDVSACSIACTVQYPSQCVSNQYGQSQGSCSGVMTTTTAIPTVAPWLGYACSCLYCPSGYTCSSNTLIGIASASECSSSDCTLACQNRFPLTCTTTYLSQITGVCLTQNSGRTRCKCNCCGTTGCIDYELTTNDTCSSCYARCQQVSPCTSTRPVTYVCTADGLLRTANLTLSIFILILLIDVSFLN